MKYWNKLKDKLKALRLSRGYYTLEDVLFAIETAGNAKDRDDFQWKLKCRLRDMRARNHD